MQFNNSFWEQYKEGWIDPMYKPYRSEEICVKTSEATRTDPNSGTCQRVKIYPEKTLPTSVEPLLLRRGKGIEFEKMYPQYPCPMGWKQDPNRPTFCVKETYDGGQTFYTDQAFIVKKQFLNEEIDTRRENTGTLRNLSMDPYTGQRKEYLSGKVTRGTSKYVTSASKNMLLGV